MGDSEVPIDGLRDRLGRLVRSEAAWVAAAFALRAGFGIFLGERTYQADEAGFTQAARSMAEHGVYGIAGEPKIGPPLAPALISVSFLLGGGHVLARVLQAAVSAATAWMIGRMTRDATGSPRAGLLALAVASVYPFFIYYSGMLMSETVYLAAAVGGLWALARSLGERGERLSLAAAAGAAFAAAALTRGEGAPIALGLWILLALACAARGYSWKAWALACACWALPLAGWMARNHSRCGKFALDANRGKTMLDGTRFYDIDQDDTAFSRQALKLAFPEAEAMDEFARDDYYLEKAVEFMRENPGTTARQWVQKAVAFWRFYPRLDKKYPETATAEPNAGFGRGVLAGISLLFEPALILGGFYGAWLMRDKLATLFPYYWLVLATFGLHVIVVSQMRYRLPVMPVMILFACSHRRES